MPYSTKRYLRENTGNNAFAWEERKNHYAQSPFLTIAALIQGNIDDVSIGNDIVFEENIDQQIHSYQGLKNLVKIGENIVIFDNHNHALYFWIDALRHSIVDHGFELIHIDEHSDLWDNPHDIDIHTAILDPEYVWKFTHHACNVGNYIQPLLRNHTIKKMIRIENEFEMDRYMSYVPSSNSVLNLDLDIFAPELDYIDENKKIDCIVNLMRQVKYITIASSPFFIDQDRAIKKLKKILSKSI